MYQQENLGVEKRFREIPTRQNDIKVDELIHYSVPREKKMRLTFQQNIGGFFVEHPSD